MAKNILTDLDLNKNKLLNVVIEYGATTTIPSDATQGQLYYDITANELKIYNGSSWEEISKQTEIVSAIEEIIKTYVGEDTSGNSTVTLGTTEPDNASAGDLFYNTTSKILRIYTGSEWTDCSSSTVDLSNYITTESLNTELSNYVTTNSLTTKLGDYVTTDSLTTKLGNYATADALNDYPTTEQLETAASTIVSNIKGTSPIKVTTSTSDYSTSITHEEVSGSDATIGELKITGHNLYCSTGTHDKYGHITKDASSYIDLYTKTLGYITESDTFVMKTGSTMTGSLTIQGTDLAGSSAVDDGFIKIQDSDGENTLGLAISNTSGVIQTASSNTLELNPEGGPILLNSVQVSGDNGTLELDGGITSSGLTTTKTLKLSDSTSTISSIDTTVTSSSADTGIPTSKAVNTAIASAKTAVTKDLTLQWNGTSKIVYDGTADKTLNFTTVNSGPTLDLKGTTATIGTVNGVALTAKSPTLSVGNFVWNQGRQSTSSPKTATIDIGGTTASILIPLQNLTLKRGDSTVLYGWKFAQIRLQWSARGFMTIVGKAGWNRTNGGRTWIFSINGNWVNETTVGLGITGIQLMGSFDSSASDVYQSTSLSSEYLLWEKVSDSGIFNLYWITPDGGSYPAYELNLLSSGSYNNDSQMELVSISKVELTSADSIPTVDNSTVYRCYIGRCCDANNVGSLKGITSIAGDAIKTSTSVTDLGWSSDNTNKIPTLGAITYWNGAYSGTSSNLLYTAKGALGTACTKGVDTTATSGSSNLITSGAMYTALSGKASSSHTHSYLPLTGGALTGNVTNTKSMAIGGSTISSTYALYVTGSIAATTGVYQTSDERLKNIAEELPVINLEDIDSLPIIYYTLKDEVDGKRQLGTIAQKIINNFPELVSIDENGYYSVDYARLSLVAIAGVKQLNKRLMSIEDKLNNLLESNG